MADPRLFTVAPCPPSYLPRSSAQISAATATRRGFFNGLGKVGDTAVLNRVGGGKVGEGLRTLASISNTIRGGCGSLPTSIGSALGAGLDTGVGWVLNNVGIASPLMSAVNSFNPGIANQALGQAEQIFRKVKQGNFKATDIPGALQDFQNLERLARNIYTPEGGTPDNVLKDLCEASPYAIDLIARAPKHKFMFVVQFIANSPFSDITTGDYNAAFVIKKTTRPNVTFQTEDVNYYNFRSKVITKTTFDPMSMTFYDDMTNSAGKFHAAIVRAMSPVTNFPTVEESFNLEGRGMDFSVDNTLSDIDFVNDSAIKIKGTPITPRMYSGSSGPIIKDDRLGDEQISIFKEIRVFHLFDGGRKMNVYKFYGPRIADLKLDELDMAVTEATYVDLSFTYDAMYMDMDVSVAEGMLAAALKDASSGHGSAVYPLRYTDVETNRRGPTNSPITPFGSPAGTTDNCGVAQNPSSTAPVDSPLVSGGGFGGGASQSVQEINSTPSTNTSSNVQTFGISLTETGDGSTELSSSD